ncbi:MAG: hypothetical protein ABJA37_13095 [Ferruginibacter sp.]
MFFSTGFSQRTAPQTPAQNGSVSIGLNSSNQQNLGGSTLDGQVFRVKASNDVEGSPLLFDDWKSGEVTLANNEKFEIDKLNMDASRDKFIYLKNDTMYEFFNEVKEVKINLGSTEDESKKYMVFKEGVNPDNGNFVQVLASGKITIFQEYDKKPEGENYSNGIVENVRKYVLHSSKSALVNKKVIPIKSYSSSALEDLTSDKKTEVEAYVKQNNLKLKKESDFLKAIDYYNSIVP